MYGLPRGWAQPAPLTDQPALTSPLPCVPGPGPGALMGTCVRDVTRLAVHAGDRTGLQGEGLQCPRANACQRHTSHPKSPGPRPTRHFICYPRGARQARAPCSWEKQVGWRDPGRLPPGQEALRGGMRATVLVNRPQMVKYVMKRNHVLGERCCIGLCCPSSRLVPSRGRPRGPARAPPEPPRPLVAEKRQPFPRARAGCLRPPRPRLGKEPGQLRKRGFGPACKDTS